LILVDHYENYFHFMNIVTKMITYTESCSKSLIHKLITLKICFKGVSSTKLKKG